MRDKQGLALIDMIVWMVLGLLLLGVLIFIMGGTLFGTEKTFSDIQLGQRSKLCETKAQLGQKFLDKDFGKAGDGFPDSCDFCLGGDNTLDSDADNIPNACDKDPNNPPEKGAKLKDLCIGDWDKKTDRCILKCYSDGTCRS